MEAIAKTRHLKGSPRKARLVIDLIRGRNVSQALNILKFTDKRAADPIAKTLRSAIANATYLAEQQNIAIDPDDLFVKTCFVDMGAHKNRRRMRPAPQGRAFREQRHYCHITILVSSDAPVETRSSKKSKQTSAEKGTDGAKMKAAPKAKAVKETKTVAAAAPVEETNDSMPTIESTEANVNETAATAPVEVSGNVKADQVNEQTTVETIEAKSSEAENGPVTQPETTETKTEQNNQPEAQTVQAPNSESSDILEMDSPKAAQQKEEKQKAEASDVKNVQSQTPAERNETKQADERQLDENDILELQ